MRLFEILDKLNVMDAENGTVNVGVLPDVIEVNQYTRNGNIKIGLPLDVAQKLTMYPGRYKALLLVIDMDEYNKINENAK